MKLTLSLWRFYENCRNNIIYGAGKQLNFIFYHKIDAFLFHISLFYIRKSYLHRLYSFCDHTFTKKHVPLPFTWLDKPLSMWIGCCFALQYSVLLICPLMQNFSSVLIVIKISSNDRMLTASRTNQAIAEKEPQKIARRNFEWMNEWMNFEWMTHRSSFLLVL